MEILFSVIAVVLTIAMICLTFDVIYDNAINKRVSEYHRGYCRGLDVGYGLGKNHGKRGEYYE